MEICLDDEFWIDPVAISSDSTKVFLKSWKKCKWANFSKVSFIWMIVQLYNAFCYCSHTIEAFVISIGSIIFPQN